MNEGQKKSSNIATILWLVFFFPVGLYFLWAKTNWNKKVKYGITSVFLLLIIISAIGGSTPSSDTATKKVVAQQTTSAPTATSVPTTPKPTQPPTPTPTDVPTDVNGFPMNAEKVTVSDMDKTPSDYSGKKVTFTCTVLSFARDSSGNAAAINCADLNDYTSIAQIDTGAYDIKKINQSDTVRIYGIGSGAFTGKNAYGADVTEAGVLGMYINDVTSGYSNSK